MLESRSMEGCKVFLVCLIVLFYVACESFTKEANPCYPEQIPCDSGDCIKRNEWCDKYPDCLDDSDENYCKTKGFLTTPDNKCNETLHFVCANKKCVPRVLECDGFDDCKDKSDEKNCPESETERDTESEDRWTTSEPVSTSAFDNDSSQTTPESNPDPRATREPDSSREFHRRGDVPYPYPHATQEPVNPREFHSRGNVPYPYPSATQEPVNPREFHSREKVPCPYPSATQEPINPREFHSRGNVPYPYPSATQEPVNPREFHSRGNAPCPDPRAPDRDKPVTRSWPLPTFRFAADRTQSFGRLYGEALVRAERWLMGQEMTPRVLVALSLAQNSFHPNTTDYEIMRRRLKLDLGSKLLRNTENLMFLEKERFVHKLAMYINALMATCQDPRQIYGQDLVSLLHDRTHNPRWRTIPSPFPLLTLCLANSSVTNEDFAFLQNMVNSPIIGDVSKDRFILSTSALACIHKRGLYANEIRRVMDAASRKLLDQQYDDGSFGSIYSTALAVQAFFALDSNIWNPDRTMDFLIRHQLHDGSFGDVLATSYILPILSGRSLIHLRDIQCEAPTDEPSSEGWENPVPKKTISYSLSVGREQRNRITWQITVPCTANFFEIMQEAQKLHSRYRFLYTESFGKIDVYSISDVPNDPERSTYWLLFVLDERDPTIHENQIYYGDIRNLIPRDNQELLYWYLPYRGRLS